MNPAALQEAVYDALVADATLLAALSSSWTDSLGAIDPIFADVPQENAEDAAFYPFISFGPHVGTPWNTKGTTGENAVIQVNVWSRAADYTQAKQIAERVHTLLHRQALTIAGQTHVETEFDSQTFSLDPDGETRRALMFFRVIYDNS